MVIAPQVSVVMPTHARHASLMRVLGALALQNVTPDTFEVLVICDGDVDGSMEACTALAQQVPYVLRVFEQQNLGPAAARNRGVVEAQAPLVLFLDDDVVPDERVIETHIRAQQGQDSCVTIGPLLPPPDFHLNAWGAWEEHALCRQYDAMTSGRWGPGWRQFYTGNASVLKRHVLDVGGFDPTYRRAEDVELALRLRDHGLHFAFLSQARGWHYVSRTFRSWQRMAEEYGVAEVLLALGGRPELLKTSADHFYLARSRPVRIATWVCAGRPVMTASCAAVLGMLARGAHFARSRRVSHAACSLIFNVWFYHGMARALGSREMLLRVLRHTDPRNQPEAIIQQVRAHTHTASMRASKELERTMSHAGSADS